MNITKKIKLIENNEVNQHIAEMPKDEAVELYENSSQLEKDELRVLIGKSELTPINRTILEKILPDDLLNMIDIDKFALDESNPNEYSYSITGSNISILQEALSEISDENLNDLYEENSTIYTEPYLSLKNNVGVASSRNFDETLYVELNTRIAEKLNKEIDTIGKIPLKILLENRDLNTYLDSLSFLSRNEYVRDLANILQMKPNTLNEYLIDTSILESSNTDKVTSNTT